MRVVRWILLGLAGLLVVLQLVPYGRDHSNPPVTADAPWSSPEVRRLAVRACYDCHSNETDWRWYSHVAPVSWLVKNHVDAGRRALNFSEWDRPQGEARELAESLTEGSMPLRSYLMLHPSARLSTSEKAKLLAALRELAPPRSDRGPQDHD